MVISIECKEINCPVRKFVKDHPDFLNILGESVVGYSCTREECPFRMVNTTKRVRSGRRRPRSTAN